MKRIRLDRNIVEVCNIDDIAVTIDVNQTNIGYGSNVSHANVPASLTSVLLLATNSNRREVHITNDSNGVLYVKYGAGITATNYTYKLYRKDAVTINDYRGDIYGIGTNAVGFYMVEENSY